MNLIPIRTTSFKKVFLLLLLIMCTSLFSQNNKGAMSFEHLTIEDGLSALYITDILQDHQGFMWFASTFGLNKYDGYTITTYNFDNKDPNSISDDVIRDLFEDSEGVLWIATENGGINKYDRESDSFIRYQNNPSDSTSISHNFVRRIYEDKKGTLWIGTMAGGLNKMNKEKGTFTHYSADRNDETTLPGNYVFDIIEDRSERLWIATIGGLSILNRDTGKFSTYKNNPSDPNSLNGNRVFSIYEDNQGILWVGTNLGLNKFNEKDKTFSSYMFDYKDEREYVQDIKEDKFDNLLVGIEGDNGLIKFNKTSKTFSINKHDSQDKNSVGDGSVTSIYEDRSNILWIGTNLGGISIYKPQKASNFIHHKYNANNNSVSEGAITSIHENSEGDIWLTNYNGIIDKINVNGKVTQYNKFIKEEKEYKPTAIHTLLENKNKDVIVGTDKGLYKLNKSTNSFEHQIISANSKFFNEAPILSMVEDKKEFLWLGVNSNGLIKLDKEQKEQSYFKPGVSYFKDGTSTDLATLSSEYVNSVYEDPLGTLWIATVDGLNKMDKETNTFTSYQHNPLDSTSISHSYIVSLHKDYFGSLWVATYFGLNVLDEKTGVFRHFFKEGGLPENIVYTILEDKNNNIWIATKNYLSKFNPKTETFRTFNKGNGMSINEFYPGASLMASNGKMYFGGVNGMIEFHPDSLINNSHVPPIMLTDFKISNKSVGIKKDSLIKKGTFFLRKNINVSDTISLSYINNNFSFEFTALDYVYSLSNQYAYRMKGFNEDWIYTNANNRSATYTNLDPGSYVFEVKGSNNDGLWNESGKSVVVIISPPWWKTNWAYFLYLAGFLGSLFGFIKWRALKLERDKKTLIENVKIKTKDLADKNVQLDSKNLQLQDQATQLQELDKIKASFFANISHEFRTPLTVITGLANKHISKNESETSTQDSKTIKRNAQRLLQLINQLLDLSKLENSEVKLNILKTDILYFTKKILLLYESLARDKQIKIFFNQKILGKSLPTEKIDLYFDKEKMQKIVTNLISNAIKFTPHNGEIKMSVHKNNGSQITIEISNTGSQIQKSKLPFIFDRFYQVENRNTSENEGTGIGLALVKELVELHQGTVKVKSNSNETTFILKFPYNKKLHVKNTKIINENSVIEVFNESEVVSSEQKPSSNHSLDLEFDSKISTKLDLLIVEDNPDLRSYITGLLDLDYNITQAVNGFNGLEVAKNTIPDLIISDVMMPKMDGYELCEKLKTNETTDHIPVILLTAKAAQENKLEGLQTGADAYLTKPFDEKELKVRIINLIENRERLQKKWQKESFRSPKDVKVTSVQQKFLQKIKEIVDINIDNDQFSIENLGEALFMSRSQVHRKLKAITDQSASHFIRNYRLHRAADLLNQGSGNITEIAYQVGFSSQSYFSKCFQELFGTSPSDYKSQ